MWLGHHFQGQKVKVTRPVYSPRRLGIGSCSGQRGNVLRAWETAATLPSAGAAVGWAARGAKAPTGEERGGGISCRHAHSLLELYCLHGVTVSSRHTA